MTGAMADTRSGSLQASNPGPEAAQANRVIHAADHPTTEAGVCQQARARAASVILRVRASVSRAAPRMS